MLYIRLCKDRFPEGDSTARLKDQQDNVFTSVCDSVHGGGEGGFGFSGCIKGHDQHPAVGGLHPGGGCLHPGGGCLPTGGSASVERGLADPPPQLGKRAVRILLECCLALF